MDPSAPALHPRLPLSPVAQRKADILLSHAIAQGSLDLVRLRLNQGADPLVLIDMRESWNQARKEPSVVATTALMAAAARGHAAIVKELLPLSDPLAANLRGETALMHATKRASLPCLELLLPHSDPLARDHQGRDALMTLAREGHGLSPQLAACARLLSPFSDRSFVDDEGCDALMIAVQNNVLIHGNKAQDIQLIEALAVGRDPRAVDNHGQTALMKALGEGCQNFAEALLPFYDDDALALVDENKHDAAYLAARSRNGPIAAKLSRRHPRRDYPPYESSTLLMVAASAGSVDSVKALLPDSDPLAVDANGCDALMLAIDHGSARHCEAALALIPFSDLFRRDATGMDAMDKAKLRGFEPVINALSAIRLALSERDGLSEDSPSPVRAAPGARTRAL